MTEIEALMNEHIRNMVPYSSARDEFTGHADVYLDANESWRGGNDGINRYPDPLSSAVRKKLEEVLSLPYAYTAIANGSDEAIDMLIRIFCSKSDSIMISRPTYGAYRVFADLNDVSVIDVRLRDDLSLDEERMIAEINEKKPKIVFICSPNNPTGRVYPISTIRRIADANPGITVVDEAYADFSEGFESAVNHIAENNRIAVIRTLSKAWGIAGARIGILIACEEIISVFIKAKAPYNVSRLSQDEALKALNSSERVSRDILQIRSERSRLCDKFRSYPFVKWVQPSEANFILIGVSDPDGLCSFLRDRGIIVRNRAKEPLLEGGVRVTIGSDVENKALEEALDEYSAL